MKLRIFFAPSIVVLLATAVAGLFWTLTLALPRPYALVALAPAIFYSALAAVCGWARWRIHVLQRGTDWEAPRRLLVLAPHEDDCAICAGGIGARNRRLGGVTRIVYLAPDEGPGMATRRAAEARAAWREADVGPENLQSLDLLPALRRRDPRKLRAAAETLRSIIDDFRPDTIVMPMFEGGHIHHDMAAALIGSLVTPQDRFEIFEAPEYSPYVSLMHTPHRVIALSARWLGFVSYYGPPDGIDERPVLEARLDAADLDTKRRMLGAFVSQNAPSLMETRSYPDRLVRWDPSRRRRTPFDLSGSYLALVLAARRFLPARLVDRLLPGETGTIGRDGRLTDWTEEWGVDEAVPPQ